MSKDDKNITEDAFNRIKKMVGSDDEDEIEDPVKDVNLVFSTTERVEIYDHILGMLRSGEKDVFIAQKVVGILNDHIAERMARAKKRKKGKSPIFRRIG